MNHDLLILTTGTRHDLFVRMREKLERAIARADGPFRVTMIVDGEIIPEVPYAHRVVHHRTPQGIAFGINEWIEYLELTRIYYQGHSSRTSDYMAFEPCWCTVLQDDVEVEPWLFAFIEKHHKRLEGLSAWFSGYQPTEHTLLSSCTIEDTEIEHRAMGCAVHLTAHFDRWRELTPIPKLFGKPRICPGGDVYKPGAERGNPSRRPRLGSRVEHWLLGDCKKIVTQPGVAVIRGGAQHIGDRRSVWNETS